MTRGGTTGLRGSNRRWWIAGLVAFVVVDIALIWSALDAVGHGRGSASEPIPISSFAPAPSSSPASRAPGATPTPTPTQAPIVLETMARRLVPIDADGAWRVATVACGGPVSIESTGDGGASWTAWPTGDDVAGVRDIVGYTGDSSMVGIIASLAGDCRAEYRISFTGGEFWGSYPDEQPTESVVIDPGLPGVLIGPAGGVASPCGEVSEFAVSASGAAVLCVTTDVLMGPMDLSAWTPVAVRGAVVAITNAGDGYVIAARRDSECVDGLRLSVLGADGSVTPGICMLGYNDEAVPVTLASAPDGALWIWVGDRVGVSSDGGASWAGLG